MSRAITCPCCGGGIAVKAAGYTVSVACQYCGSLLDVAHPDVAVITQYHEAVARLALPLGSRGVMFGAQWEVIGWLAREGGGYSWEEYLLFNPYAGYRWLVRSDGEWQFGEMLTDLPRETGRWGEAEWRGAVYSSADEPVTVTTLRVLGEFYWRVSAGEMWVSRSYERGEHSLSREWHDGEAQWTHLVPVPRGMIDGFARPDAPERERPASPAGAGFWARWPLYGEHDLKIMLLIGSVTALLCWMILGIPAAGVPQAGVAANVIVDGPELHFTVGQVTVTPRYHYVSITVQGSDFVNRWVDVDWRLVNRATQQAIPASSTLEYYTGRDSDGDWAQGSHEQTALIASVPRGTYDLVGSAKAKSWNDPAATYAPPVSAPTDPWAIAPNGAGEAIALRIGVSTGGDNGDWRMLLVLLALAGPGVILLWRGAKGGA
jgi:hypothetical protein